MHENGTKIRIGNITKTQTHWHPWYMIFKKWKKKKEGKVQKRNLQIIIKYIFKSLHPVFHSILQEVSPPIILGLQQIKTPCNPSQNNYILIFPAHMM